MHSTPQTCLNDKYYRPQRIRGRIELSSPVEWHLKGSRDGAFASQVLATPPGKELLTMMLVFSNYDDEVVAKYSMDITSSMVLKGGLDVFTDKESKAILLDGLKVTISAASSYEAAQVRKLLKLILLHFTGLRSLD
eukprot:74029-Prorocentrum_minimum.AAC.2